MQFLVAAIMGGLLQIAQSMLGRVLLGLGLSFVTYQGFDVLMESVNHAIKDNFNAMGADVVSFLAFLWVDKAIGVLFSAYSAAMVVKFGTGNTIKRLVRK